MRGITSILCLLTSASLCSCSPAPGTVEWSRVFKASTFGETRLGVDGSGRLGLAAPFSGQIVDDGALTPGHRQGGTLLAVVDPGGDERWVKQLGIMDFHSMGGLVANAQGHWLLAGVFADAIALDPNTLIEPLSKDMFVADFDPDGNLVWSKHFSADMGGASGAGTISSIAGLAVSPQGDIVAAGAFTGTFGFGGPPLHPDATPPVPGTNVTSGFVVELNAQGAHRWSLALAGVDSAVTALAFDQDGGLLIAGTYDTAVNLGEKALDGGAGQHAFLGKLGPGGEPWWFVKIAGGEQEAPRSIAAAPGGNVFVAGTCVVPSGQGQCSPSVTAFSHAGELLWRRPLDAGVLSADGTAVDEDGHVLVTGAYEDASDPSAPPPPSLSAEVPFLVEIDGSGNIVESRTFGHAAPKSAATAIVLQGGKVVISGECKEGSGVCGRTRDDPWLARGRFLLTVER